MHVPSLSLRWEFLAPPVVQVSDGFTGVHSAFTGAQSVWGERVDQAKPLALALPLSVKLAWQALDFISIPWLLGWQQAVILVWLAKP